MTIYVNGDTVDSVTFAKAIADETRQKIMQILCCRWLCVGDVVEQLGGISQPTVSHHLAILRDTGLVHTQRDGRQIYYSLNQDAIAVCCGTLMQVFAPDKVEDGAVVRLTDITVN
jgi:ArsR family transcriptional regulator